MQRQRTYTEALAVTLDPGVFGALVADECRRLGWAYAELARRANVTRNTVSRVCRGFDVLAETRARIVLALERGRTDTSAA